jgi:hypothetical protein
MKKSYSTKLQELLDEVVKKLIVKLCKNKEHCLEITDDNLMFNLDASRWLTQITLAGRDKILLVDNSDYRYDCSCLSVDEFLAVADHLLSKK